MKSTIIVYILTLLLIAVITPAKAQQYPAIPKTIKLINSVNGEQIGTATISGKTTYFRDNTGEHYATIVRNADGTQTLYDPSGKLIEAQSLNLPNMPE